MKVKTDKCEHTYKEECCFCEDWKTEIAPYFKRALKGGENE